MGINPFLRIKDCIYPIQRLSFYVTPGAVSIFVEGDESAIATYSGENAARWRVWLRAHTEELDLLDDRYADVLKGSDQWR